MNARSIITIVLVAFVVVSVVYLITHESRSGDRDAAPDAAVIEDETEHKVIAYYFHGDKRCRTCFMIETFTGEAIKEGFPRQLESGKLELRIVNVDEPGNGHFIGNYKLTTKSVIIAEYRDGVEERWKNLNLVWEYVNDKESFLDYIRRETEGYLGESVYE